MKRPAFSLIELVVVIAILGILVSLTMGGIGRVRSAQMQSSSRDYITMIQMKLDKQVSAVRARVMKPDNPYRVKAIALTASPALDAQAAALEQQLAPLNAQSLAIQQQLSVPQQKLNLLNDQLLYAKAKNDQAAINALTPQIQALIAQLQTLTIQLTPQIQALTAQIVPLKTELYQIKTRADALLLNCYLSVEFPETFREAVTPTNPLGIPASKKFAGLPAFTTLLPDEQSAILLHMILDDVNDNLPTITKGNYSAYKDAYGYVIPLERIQVGTDAVPQPDIITARTSVLNTNGEPIFGYQLRQLK